MKKITKFLNNFFKETEEGCYQPKNDLKMQNIHNRLNKKRV